MELTRCLDILDLPHDLPSVTFEEAKSAYRLLAQVWHPDRYAHNEKLHAKATAKMQEINAAWHQVEDYFKSGTAATMRESQQEEEVDDYRTDVAHAMRDIYNRNFRCF